MAYLEGIIFAPLGALYLEVVECEGDGAGGVGLQLNEVATVSIVGVVLRVLGAREEARVSDLLRTTVHVWGIPVVDEIIIYLFIVSLIIYLFIVSLCLAHMIRQCGPRLHKRITPSKV